MQRLMLLTFFYFFQTCLINTSFGSIGDYFNYFVPKRDVDNDRLNDLETLPIVPYELAEKDEQFLQEAAKFISASMTKLDVCHHRVILTLKDSCHNLNSEMLGKLSVMLLNCQSDTEGRVIYPCTDTMTLKQCTIQMDPDTWNAYHLITNRAKAICTAVRQEQFRGLTELTVNKLMKTAHEQLYMMDELTKHQDQLQGAMVQAINELNSNNVKLIDQQQDMIKLSDDHRETVQSTLMELKIEKGLIKSGQIEVADMIGRLKQKLDQNMINLKKQFTESKSTHEELVKDLDELYRSARRISEKLSETTELVLSQTELTSGQFDITMKQLHELNVTISNLATILKSIESDVDEKLNWILNKLGGTDTFIKNVNIVLVHSGYLLLGMLLIVFLNGPTLHRILFIILISFNFCASLLNIYPMDMLTFTIVLFSLFIGDYIRRFIMCKYFKNILTLNSDGENVIATTKTEHNHDEVDKHNETTGLGKFEQNKFIHRWLNNNIDCSKSDTSFSSSLGDRIRCTSLTIKGIQCKNAAIENTSYCRTHNTSNHSKSRLNITTSSRI